MTAATVLHRAGTADRAAAGLRVLCISHSAISRIHGRLRYGPLLDRRGVTLKLLMPDRWFERGQWHAPDPPRPGEDWVEMRPIRLPRAGRAKWHLHHYPGLHHVLRRFAPDVIHLWQEPWSAVALQTVALRTLLCPGVPVVLEVDQNILKRLPPPFERIRRTVLSQTAMVLARSTEALDVVRACGFRGPASQVGYGVDRDVFRPAADRDAVRARLGLTGFTVGYAGRLIEEKGLADLVTAIARMRMPASLVLLGEGPFAPALRAQADALGIGPRVRMLPWAPPEDVAAFMGAIDLFALLTRTTAHVREQFGRVIIEAQACGTPVIGTECGAIPDVVGAGGWIVPERAPDAVAALLDHLARTPAERAAAAACADTQIRQRHSFEVVSDVLEAAWRRVGAGVGVGAGVA